MTQNQALGRRNTQLWAASIGVLVALVLLAVPAWNARAQSSECEPYFDLTELSEEHKAWATEALAGIWFPCARFDSGLDARDRDAISVRVSELDGHRGYNSEGVEITIDTQVTEESQWRETFTHEIGHSVDFLTLTDPDREEIKRIFRDPKGCWLEDRCSYENRIGEVFANAFTRGFSRFDSVATCPAAEWKCARYNKRYANWERSTLVAQVVWF